MFEMLSQASIVAKLSLAVGVLPLGFGVAYAARPSEQRLAVMRPISLAAIFAGLTGSTTGAINVLSVMWRTQPPFETHVMAIGSAEALVSLLVPFGSLTIAWLCVAIGIRRHP